MFVVRIRGTIAAGFALCAFAPATTAAAQQVREVQIAPPFLRMREGAETRVLATAYDDAGNPVETAFRWSSSNINVVTVTPDGLIRALAPGAAIVTATVLGGPRRRSGRISVHVGMPGGAVAVPQPPRPPAPPPHLESLVRASINCDDPFVSAVNPARACWDRPALPRARPLIAVPAACDKPPSQTSILVQVSEQGQVVEVRTFVPSHCAAFQDSAMAFARTLSFMPARREGQPIRAWVRLTIRAQPQ